MKKIIGVLMAASLVMSSLAGCGNSKNAQSGAKASNEKLSFRVTTVSFGENPTGKPAETAWLKKCEELMGRKLDITFQYIDKQDYAEKFKIMLSSNDLPDIVTNWGLSQDELCKYGEQGVFVDLSKNLDKMPNYKKLIDAAPASKTAIYSKAGNLYGEYFVKTNSLSYDGGREMGTALGIRKDVFDKNGIAMPTTIDELYQAAVKLKAMNPKKYPMFQMEEWQNPLRLLYNTNHVSDDKYYNGSKYAYGPLQEGYKDALVEMNRWYAAGLISPDYFTQTQANGNATLAAGDGIILPAMWDGYPAQWETKYPNQKWVLVSGIKNPKYGAPWTHYTYTTDKVSISNAWCLCVNSRSKNVDDMIKFLDYQLSDDVSDIVNWGIKGETYTVGSDQSKKYTDAILKDVSGSLSKYGIGTGTCRSGVFPQIQDALSFVQQESAQNNLADGKAVRAKPSVLKRDYMKNKDEEEPMAVVTPLTAEETEQYAEIMTPINTYASEQATKFIKGQRPFSEWNKFIGELNAMGDIQKAMDIYNKHITK